MPWSPCSPGCYAYRRSCCVSDPFKVSPSSRHRENGHLNLTEDSSEGVAQEGPGLFLHGSVKRMIATAERPAVAIVVRVQALQLIMSLFHPGAREELVIGPVLNQKSRPTQGGELRPVHE